MCGENGLGFLDSRGYYARSAMWDGDNCVTRYSKFEYGKKDIEITELEFLCAMYSDTYTVTSTDDNGRITSTTRQRDCSAFKKSAPQPAGRKRKMRTR